VKDRLGVLTVRPWPDDAGDPAAPTMILGRRVRRTLASRADDGAALVLLEDRRMALTGPVLAVGRPLVLAMYLRRRAFAAPHELDRVWLARCSRVARSGPA